ncbi:hypothetical protein FRB91_003799 [Serendipita sp. 411]|nr:hypothetical protein FRB91_003799 [Serendipita sp. 411]
MSACGSCQGSLIVKWSTWRQNCPGSLVTVASYPLEIPFDTAVPAWAYLNITLLDKFDAAMAQTVLDEPDVTPGNQTISTSSSSFTQDTALTPTSTSSSTFTASETDPATGSSSRKNSVPAIVGGRIVGVVGFIVWVLH